jgi:hypothetical protein
MNPDSVKTAKYNRLDLKMSSNYNIKKVNLSTKKNNKDCTGWDMKISQTTN